MSQPVSKLKLFWNDIVSSYQVNKCLKYYNKKQYDKLAAYFNKKNIYDNVKIDNYSFLFYVLSEKNTDLLKLMLNQKNKLEMINNFDNSLKITPLVFAVINNLFEEADLILMNGGNIHYTTSDLNNVVHYVCAHSDKNALKYCIAHKCNIDQQNKDGFVPIMNAILNEKIELIEEMIKIGARLDIPTNDGYFPLHMAIETENFDVIKLLENSLPELERTKKLTTHPIHIAAKCEDFKILEYFLKSRSSATNLPDIDGNTPTHYAARHGKQNNIVILARYNGLFNLKNKNGDTPLHAAVLSDSFNEDTLKNLILHGADPYIKNNDDMDPIDLSLSMDKKDCVSFFRANCTKKDFFNIYHSKNSTIL